MEAAKVCAPDRNAPEISELELSELPLEVEELLDELVANWLMKPLLMTEDMVVIALNP